jgi:hypothetical protein
MIPTSQRPVSLTVAAAVVALEAFAAVAAGVGFLVAALTGEPADRGTAVTLAVLLLVLGAGLALVARGLFRSRPPAQTPAYLAQFFTLVVAYYQRHTLLAVTVALAVMAVLVLAALSAPASRAALRRE